MKPRTLLLLLGLGASQALAVPAAAVTSFALMPAAALTATFATPPRAGCQVQPGIGTAGPTADPSAKTAALLGGAPSQLDLIMRQQSGGSTSPQAPAPGLAPARLNVAAGPGPCATGTGLTAARVGTPLGTSLPGEFLASRRLSVSRTGFDDDWQRVSQRGLRGRLISGANRAGGNNSGRYARLLAVNAWANGRIRYAEDRTLYGKADYWADARTTLRLGAGDCEDIAILKMQLLAAAGVPRDAMFLTIARDLARGADHAMLVVRDGERFWLLDNATNVLSDAAAGADYRPIMSFSGRDKWVHGY